MSGKSGEAARACADVGPADHQVHDARGHVGRLGNRAGRNGVAGHGAERRLFRRLPDQRIAADQRQHRVPGPHRDRKIEGRDHADRAERMPLLHQAVTRPLAGDREAVELAAQSDGEVADVDHLLDFAQRLFENLAALQRHEHRQVVLGLAEVVADPPHEFAALGRRHERAIASKARFAAFDRLRRASAGAGRGKLRERCSVDRTAHVQGRAAARRPVNCRWPRLAAAARPGGRATGQPGPSCLAPGVSLAPMKRL